MLNCNCKKKDFQYLSENQVFLRMLQNLVSCKNYDVSRKSAWCQQKINNVKAFPEENVNI